MKSIVDTPLTVLSTLCYTCNIKDTHWYLWQFLADGMWRRLSTEKTLRSQGIDEEDLSRVYLVHICCEKILETFRSTDEINAFEGFLHSFRRIA